MGEVHVTATGPDGEPLGEWRTDDDGTHTPVTASTKPGDPNWIEAGDPRYAGFRITDLWAILIVDEADDQETVAMVSDPTYGSLPLLASDERRLESSLRPTFDDLRKHHSNAKVRLVHFRAVDE